ncbi:hypothetical protein Y032_0366g7 [Ancylostoma ceylanicum]|uniref:Uncharacterized protein n=1 Tax=Ancylostoma ceylanicum TaxID=53326 RepID=A0A016RVM3_9BILA|nr:hypothetical protein Y032_0366g7 [Ancylostoma ceylanicum]
MMHSGIILLLTHSMFSPDYWPSDVHRIISNYPPTNIVRYEAFQHLPSTAFFYYVCAMFPEVSAAQHVGSAGVSSQYTCVPKLQHVLKANCWMARGWQVWVYLTLPGLCYMA